MRSILKLTFSTLILLLLFNVSLMANVRLPKLVSDGMILQRDTPLKIWGWADADEKINMRFNNLLLETGTPSDGKWQITLPAQKAGGPYEIEFSAKNKIVLKDVWVGDVWLCSGQSNMEYPMNRLADKYAREIASCENTQIRQFKVAMKYDFNQPVEDYSTGKWEAVNPQTILNFSAVAYFFAKELNEKYKVPIGIINASVGGSPAEAWMSAKALKEFPNYLVEAEKFKNQTYINEIQSRERKASNEWYALMNQTDKGLQAKPRWKDPSFNPAEWPSMPIPGYWADHGLGAVNGAIWFRREIEVPSSMTGKSARLQMGRIVDADSIFINGKIIGTTGYQYPQRNYPIPASILRPGKNVVVIRVISNSGKGGFIPDKPYRIFADSDTISLTGNWQVQVGCKMPPTPGSTFVQWKPTGLYNGMIAPANNYSIKGVVWYQGESNAERWQEYQKLLTAMITDWRLKHAQGNFPFVIAQLPNFMEAKSQPSESSWAEFRNVQQKIAQTVENVALSVNIDLGEWNDIHPLNKQDVGKRLALAAQKLAYNEKKIVASGPVFQSMKMKGNKIELSFSNCGSGLVSWNGKELKQFAIAGTDGKFVWAKAEIQGNKVVVWNDAILKPATVRYAWADNPDGANLFNKEGLPASPFCTRK